MRSEAHSKTVFPVGLLLEGRSCLVVGSGKVAVHKAQLLLDAKASVTVVGPDADGEITSLVASGSISYIRREFQDSDVKKNFLVFAATNDKIANRHVMECCRAHNILCCSVDGNWMASDFVTPAIIRQDGLTLSISSGGKSCRRSRLVKENLSRHIEMVASADLIVIGTSHHQMSIQRREPFHLIGSRMNDTGEMLMRVWGIHEFMLLNTCNRIEFIGVVSKEAGIVELLKRILAFFHLKEEEYYVKRGYDAFEHVAVVSAGLLSQSPGENHIVAQLKEALDYSISRKWAGGMIQEWIGSVLHVSKEIRNVTEPLLGSLEIEDLSINYLKTRYKNLANKRIMILGTGMVGLGLMKLFMDLGNECEWCYHVNKPEIQDSWKGRFTLTTLNDLPSTLHKVDVVICTTSSPGYVLHRGHAPFLNQDKDITILDLSIPRNVEPAMDGLTPNLKVVDLDGLKRWYHKEILDMTKVFELSREVVAEHKDLCDKVVKSFQSDNRTE